MKKIVVLVSIFFGLVSCKKAYYCKCETETVMSNSGYSSTNKSTSTEYLGKKKKKEAEKECAEMNTTASSNFQGYGSSVNRKCELN